MNHISDIEKARQQQQEALVAEQLALEKALSSNDPATIVRAQSFLKQKEASKVERKSIFTDPMDVVGALGYKNKPTNLSYGLLRRMATTPIINSIISTRVDQVANFANPQEKPTDFGFIIEKKIGHDTRSKRDIEEIVKITEFMVNCGRDSAAWQGDDFDQFLRKITQDSLVLDQMTAEITRDRRGNLYEFLATDAATHRLADNLDDARYFQRSQIKQGQNLINGYAPKYVQIYNNTICAEYYPWELMFGIRRQTTDIYNAGYGISELEILINTITSMLYSDEYNKRVFSQGSVPKGFLRIKGQIGNNSLQQFKQQWLAQVSGVANSHRVPFIEGDEVEWVNMQSNNRDMEYSKWQEYLIKVACAVYKIDPSEVGFHLGGGGDSKPMFESSRESYVKYSKDKGLRPLVAFIQSKLQRMIVEQLNPAFRIKLVGLDAQDPSQELELDIKKMAIMGIGEIRESRGLPRTIEKDDVILSPTYLQYLGQKAQQEQMQQQQGGDGGEDDDQEDSAPDDQQDDGQDYNYEDEEDQPTQKPPEQNGYYFNNQRYVK